MSLPDAILAQDGSPPKLILPPLTTLALRAAFGLHDFVKESDPWGVWDTGSIKKDTLDTIIDY